MSGRRQTVAEDAGGGVRPEGLTTRIAARLTHPINLAVPAVAVAFYLLRQHQLVAGIPYWAILATVLVSEVASVGRGPLGHRRRHLRHRLGPGIRRGSRHRRGRHDAAHRFGGRKARDRLQRVRHRHGTARGRPGPGAVANPPAARTWDRRAGTRRGRTHRRSARLVRLGARERGARAAASRAALLGAREQLGRHRHGDRPGGGAGLHEPGVREASRPRPGAGGGLRGARAPERREPASRGDESGAALQHPERGAGSHLPSPRASE